MKFEARNPRFESRPKSETGTGGVPRLAVRFETQASSFLTRLVEVSCLRSSAFILSMVLSIVSAGCSSSPGHATSPCCATNHETTAAALTDKSLYQLDSTWTNDLGQSMKLGTLRGRVQVVAMFFASCQYACPVIVHDMKRIEAALSETVRANTRFVLVTFDTGRDTPEALRDYRARQQLAAGRWTLLRASPDDTLELAALLGVKYKQDVSGQFAHSNLITVLSPEGEIIHQQIGLNADIQPTVHAIERAMITAQKSRAPP